MARPEFWIGETKDNAIAEILDRISKGESVRSILKVGRKNLPSMNLFLKWVSEDESLSDQYARACDIRAEVIFDEMFDIADDASNDYMTKVINGEEVEVLNAEHIQRSRLRIDTRKWALSKMKPKKYGDKIDVTSAGEKIEPVWIVFTDFKNEYSQE